MRLDELEWEYGDDAHNVATLPTGHSVWKHHNGTYWISGWGDSRDICPLEAQAAIHYLLTNNGEET